jgi:hypothetical protein
MTERIGKRFVREIVESGIGRGSLGHGSLRWLGLAICLGAQGVGADPETILHHGRHRPDVLATFRGLRCAIEGKVADSSNARAQVLTDARGRIENGIAHIAIAVVYPTGLRSVEFSELRSALNTAQLDFLVLTEAGYSA